MRVSFTFRLVAIAALGAYALLLFTLVWLLASNLGFAVIFGLTAALLMYALWQVFTARSSPARLGSWLMLFGLAALAVELLYFLTNARNRHAVLAVAVLSLIYLGLVGWLRGKFWQERRRIAEISIKPAAFRNPYLIINPKSGNGRAVKAGIAELAEGQGIHVVVTQRGDDMEAVARRAVREGADVLGVSGGDGSIGAVAKVAIEHKLPLVVLPGGTRCHFARDIGLDPKRIADALTGFHGVERRVDAADINGRIFLNNVSFGLYADIVDHPQYRENKLQTGRNVVRELVNGEKDLYPLRFRHGKTRFHEAAQVLVGVNPYETLDLFELGHRERLDSGVLQITAITRLDSGTAEALLKSVTIERLQAGVMPEDFYQWNAKSFNIASPGTTTVTGVDGEREVFTNPVRVRILPGALRLFVPPEGERGRPVSPFSLLMLRRARHVAGE